MTSTPPPNDDPPRAYRIDEGAEERTVPAELDGERLDKAVVYLFEGATRARVKKAMESGLVRLNGRRAAKGQVVHEGDGVAVDPHHVQGGDGPAVPTKDAPLAVLFASERVLVLDKPAGQPCAPLENDETGTLANALVGHYPALAGVGYSPREPGLLHRLDNDTSGVVVAARDKAGFEKLRLALKDGAFTKSYLLVCKDDGLPDAGSVDHPIANHPKDQKRVLVCAHPRDVMRNAPRPASTRFEVVRRAGGWALVRAVAPRALRHQIRAHFAFLGHPLAGDALYGGEPVDGLARHALHAERVAYDGGSDATLAFDATSPLPPALAALVPDA